MRLELKRLLEAFLTSTLLASCAQQGSISSSGTEGPAAREVPALSSIVAGQGPRYQALPVPATAAEADELLARSPDLLAFLAGDGKGWEVAFDRRSGQPMLLQGPGIPWFDDEEVAVMNGRDLSRNALLSPSRDAVAILAGHSERQARALFRRLPQIFGAIDGAHLGLDLRWSGSADESNDLFYTTFRHAPLGVEQHDARMTFVVSHGQLTQIHIERVVPALADLQPRISSATAFERMLSAVKAGPGPTMLDVDFKTVLLSPEMGAPGVYQGALGRGYDQHLAYLFHFTIPDDLKTYAAQVDAQTGEVLELFDDNKYGAVTGGIFPRTSGGAEVISPFVNTRVVNGATVNTDLGGNYSYAGGTASTTLAGTFLRLTDSCGAPTASTTVAPGNLPLGTSVATDCSFSATGHTTRAGRNSFYHLNNVRRMGQKWLSGFNTTATNWFATDVGINANLAQTCNAFWNGTTVNFFRSGGGCNNTGEISDVMQHEWGHGLDQNTKAGSTGDNAKGEAVADTVALLMTHDSCIGPNFFQATGNGETAACPTGVRDLQFVVTQANISAVCPTSTTCAGALGFECHCESHLLSGAHWKLSQAFVARYGANEGWNRFEKGYLRALPGITAYLAGRAGNAYDAWMAADDDNGNVVDGTPNADIIFQSFNAQGIAGTQRPVHAVQCPTAPASPTVSATGGAGSVGLSWTAVAGATSYTITRSQGHVDGAGFLPLASGVTATSFTDAQVQPNFPYTYQVVTNVGACQSAYGAGATATPTGGGTPANDFSIALSPASSTVAAGSSTTVTVSTAVVSGVAETISLSVSGLPAGVTGSFSPASVTAGGSSTLTLTAASTAASSTSTFTVTGSAASASHTASGTLTVTGAGGGGPTQLQNGVAVTGLSGATGSNSFFVLTVPAGQTTLTFQISGGTGDADLYVRFGAQPTTTVFDCRPFVNGNSETCSFTNPAAGDWFVMLRGFAAYSGVTLRGTFTFAADTTPVLTNNVPVTGISGASASQQFWKLTVPAGQVRVVFSISGGTGDADLYVRRGARPTTATFDCRPFLNGNNETCTFTNPVAADYFVMIRGFATFSGVTLNGHFP